MGKYILALRQQAAAAVKKTPCTCCAGLIQGAPEHDFGSDTSHYYFNNNAWTLRGEVTLGTYLVAHSNTSLVELGKRLLDDAKLFAVALNESISCSTVIDSTSGQSVLPPYAGKGFVPPTTMTTTRDASYLNFRFWSEVLLADVVPRELESSMLYFHRERGGRFAGTSRFEQWTDDMPTVGWGYGALAQNRTDDFLALLYGHAATYQSRGTFHSTEQLQITGEGRYRSFLHAKDVDPDVNPPSSSSSSSLSPSSDINGTPKLPSGGTLSYFALENDVSYCIVSQSIVPKLTLWMFVFNDDYRFDAHTRAPRVWLARGVPKRFWKRGAGGFNVTRAPCLGGNVSYHAGSDNDFPSSLM
jgi:hypothetical protein